MSTDKKTLHSGIVGHKNSDEIVATSFNHNYTRGELWEGVTSLYEKLINLNCADYVLISLENGFLFDIAFSAVLYAHKKPVLIGSIRDDLLRVLLNEFIKDKTDLSKDVAFISDNSCSTDNLSSITTPFKLHIISLFDKKSDGTGCSAFNLTPPEPDSAVVFFTSGSSGTPKCIRKPLWSLEQDIRNFTEFSDSLDKYAATPHTLQDAPSSAVVVATVPCHHMYGITFRVMMPLLRNLPFYSGTITYPEELSAIKGPLILVSSPAFLGRIDFNLKAPHLVYTLSAGARLEKADALTYYSWSYCSVTEIYGSTEANIMAYRYNKGDETLFTPAPSVRFFYDNNELYIASKTLREPLKLDDELSFKDDGFSIGRRRDTIVKIAENRVSLSYIENCVRDFDKDLLEVMALSFFKGRRQFIGLVLKVRDLESYKSRTQRNEYRTRLQAYLKNYLPKVAVPRHLRFLTEFPKNSMGKVLKSELQRLFDD